MSIIKLFFSKAMGWPLSWTISSAPRWALRVPRKLTLILGLGLGLGLGLAGASAVAQTVNTQAEWEQDPQTDHLVLGGFIQTTESFRSDKPISIDTTLMLETQADTTVHLGGPITNVVGMHKGISKTGQGSLVLSGLNTYDGNLQLRQGTLELQSNHALGAIGSVVHAYLGTQLIYQPGINVPNNLQIVNAVYDPAQPPVGPYADSVQWRVNSGVATQHGYMVLDTNRVVKQGQGVLQLVGNSFDADGRLDVMQGGLQADGVIRGTAQVFDGAWLQGQGRLGQAHIGSGATLLSARQPAGLFIERSLAFEPDAVLQVDVGAAGVGGPVHVQGVASLAGWVKAHTHDLAAELWPASWEYPVLQADGGFAGTTFAGVEANMPFLQAGLRYDDNHVYLQFSPKVIVDTPPDVETEPGPVSEPDPKPDPKPVPEPVAETKPADEPVSEPKPEEENAEGDNNKVELLADKGPASGLDPNAGASVAAWPFSASWAASILSALNEDSRFLRETALRHITQPRSGAFLWADTYYSHAQRRGNRSQPEGYRDVSGLLLGLQQAWGQGGQLSIYAGVQDSRLQSRYSLGSVPHFASLQGRASATIASAHLGVSAAWQGDYGQTLAVGAAHTWHAIQSQRALMAAGLRDSASGRYGGRTSQVFAQVAMPVWQTPSSQLSRWDTPASHLTPYLQWAWVEARASAFTEKAGLTALPLAPARQRVMYTTVGIKGGHTVATNLGTAMLYGNVAWRYASGNTTPRNDFAFANSANWTIPRHSLVLQLGLEAPLGRNSRLRMGYTGLHAAHYRDHGVQLALRVAF